MKKPPHRCYLIRIRLTLVWLLAEFSKLGIGAHDLFVTQVQVLDTFRFYICMLKFYMRQIFVVIRGPGGHGPQGGGQTGPHGAQGRGGQGIGPQGTQTGPQGLTYDTAILGSISCTIGLHSGGQTGAQTVSGIQTGRQTGGRTAGVCSESPG